MSIPLYGVVVSFSHGESVVGGVLGKLARGASGCLMSYRNSGMIGTTTVSSILSSSSAMATMTSTRRLEPRHRKMLAFSDPHDPGGRVCCGGGGFGGKVVDDVVLL